MYELQRQKGNRWSERLLRQPGAASDVAAGAISRLKGQTTGSVVEPEGLSPLTLQTGQRWLQRALPGIRLPKVKGPVKYPAALLQKVKTYRAQKTDSAGAAAVAAATRWVEGQGLASYSNQKDIAAGSPEFRKRPSPAARAIAARTGSSIGAVSGFTFSHGSQGGTQQLKVEIYPDAFRGETASDAVGYLTGVITHEYIHVLQHRKGGTHTEAQREFQAWLWQGENALRMGVSPNHEVSLQIISHLERYYKQLPRKDRTRYARRYRRVWKQIQPPIKI